MPLQKMALPRVLLRELLRREEDSNLRRRDYRRKRFSRPPHSTTVPPLQLVAQSMEAVRDSYKGLVAALLVHRAAPLPALVCPESTVPRTLVTPAPPAIEPTAYARTQQDPSHYAVPLAFFTARRAIRRARLLYKPKQLLLEGFLRRFNPKLI